MRTRTIVTAVILSAGASAGILAPRAAASPMSTSTPAPAAVVAPVLATSAGPTLVRRNGRPFPPALAAVLGRLAAVPRVTAPVAAAALDAAALDRLADELRGHEPEEAAARREHFRPLCDAEGYPLVGNLPRKSSDAPVADFCAAVRTDLQAAR